MKLCRFSILALSASLLCTALPAQQGHEPWSDEVVELFSTLPVQDGGRVKPMDSYAGLHLLTLNGKRTLKLGDGTKLDQNRWLLDVFFYPELADTYPSFRVQNDGVLIAMGLESKGKRAWYSYQDLLPGQAKLEQEAAAAGRVEAIKRNPLQVQILKLAEDLRDYEALSSLMSLTRRDYPVDASEALRQLFGTPRPGLAWILPQAPALQELARTTPESDKEGFAAIRNIFAELDGALSSSFRAVALIPPAAMEDGSMNETWWRPSDVLVNSFTTASDVSKQVALFALLEDLDYQKGNPQAFAATLQDFHARVVGIAEARGEYGHIPLEVDLYRWNLFTNALVVFLLAFILAGLGMMFPQRWLQWVVGGLALTGFGLATTGIVLRCIIRGRPPVVSLYDTILFITCVVVLASLFMEWVTRQRIALFLATFLGAAGMFLAGRYELKEVASSGDTMASVVAVLDTNYYLAIHVTTVAMGYAGGLLAAAIAHVWILGRFFGLRKGDKAFYKGISRMVYGTVCFSLLFSLFGTIMGGVWANDSWGRFWGWDPKENGALLIVLWMLVILHARLGGYIRERGLANLAVLGGVVVSMSWWGVNLLNVGLHSYGFTSGVAMTLYWFWGIEALILLLSSVDALLRRPNTGGPPKPPQTPPLAPT